MASFIANHSGEIFWPSLKEVPVSLRNILLADALRCTYYIIVA